MITVTAKLNNMPNTRPMDNGGMMYFIKLGKQEYNRKTQQKEWVNYSAAIFANDKQVNFYNSNLIQGAIVSVSGSGLLPSIWGDNNDKIDLSIQDSKVVYLNNPSQAPANPPSQQFQQAQPPQQAAPSNNFDDLDDIPF